MVGGGGSKLYCCAVRSVKLEPTNYTTYYENLLISGKLLLLLYWSAVCGSSDLDLDLDSSRIQLHTLGNTPTPSVYQER